MSLCFSALWRAIEVLGCGILWWIPPGAFPIECSEHHAISMLSLSVNEACTQSLERREKGSRGTSVFQHCVWAFSCPGFYEVFPKDFTCATSYVPFQDQATHWQMWEVFALKALAMLQRPVRVSLTANRPTQPGRLHSRPHAATSTVMRAPNPDRHPPQNMYMISVTDWRTPTQKERRKTQTARVAWEQYMYQPCCFVLWWNDDNHNFRCGQVKLFHLLILSVHSCIRMPYHPSVLSSRTQLWRTCGVGARTHFAQEFTGREIVFQFLLARNRRAWMQNAVVDADSASD